MGVAYPDVSPPLSPARRSDVTAPPFGAAPGAAPPLRPPPGAMPRVYIGRLSYQARERDVERFFKGYGKILEVDLKNG